MNGSIFPPEAFRVKLKMQEHTVLTMQAGATAEWHRLRDVLVHEPGVEVFFALLAPKKHLYERFFDLEAAKREHRRLCEVLHEDFGVRVHRLRDSILQGAQEMPSIRSALEVRAEHLIPEAYPPPAGRDSPHLLSVAILGAQGRNGGAALSETMHNLYFMRDQQVCTDLGMVTGRMATRERRREVKMTHLALSALGADPVARVEEGKMEGGDFIPAGDFALIGCGARTDMKGIAALMGGMGFDEVAVVHEPLHPLIRGRDYMVSMHLDTYCNIAGEGVAVGNPALLDRAQVEVFVREGEGYRPERGAQTTLAGYLGEKGYSIVPVTTLEQLCYASNFLCVRDHEAVAVDTGQIAPMMLARLREKEAAFPGMYAALLAQAEADYRRLRAEAEFFPYKREVYAEGLDMTPVSLKCATGGYGGAHCMTCPLRR
jgi:arginine deiminase